MFKLYTFAIDYVLPALGVVCPAYMARVWKKVNEDAARRGEYEFEVNFVTVVADPWGRPLVVRDEWTMIYPDGHRVRI